MARITPHTNFSTTYDVFLRDLAVLNGHMPPRDQNILQFIIGLASGANSGGETLRMEFLPHGESKMKTLVQIKAEGFTATKAQKIADYFNHKHGEIVAETITDIDIDTESQYLTISSGALMDEIDAALEYQQISSTVQEEIMLTVMENHSQKHSN